MNAGQGQQAACLLRDKQELKSEDTHPRGAPGSLSIPSPPALTLLLALTC